MLRQISATVLATTLFLPAMPALASSTVALRGDGYCPPERYSSDPDCAREGAQWRGTGRVDGDEQAKSSRDEFPKCRASGGGGPVVYTCKGNPRDEFPGNRQGTSGPVPRAPRK